MSRINTLTQPHTKRPKAIRREAPLASQSPFVEVTLLFQDTLKQPVGGIEVRIASGTGAPPAPEWQTRQNSDDPSVLPASGAPAPSAFKTNNIDATTDVNGYAATICNAARNQPIDVLVRNRHARYVLKGTVTPSKDVTVFTLTSPEYHFDAVTKLTPKDEFEQVLNIPVIKDGEIMTVDRLVTEFGPYIGAVQKVTEQGQVKKDFPKSKKEMHTDPNSGKSKADIVIEHHYKIIDTGTPHTFSINLLASKLNYPATTKLTDDHFSYLGKALGCEPAAKKALNKQETVGGGTWKPDGGFDVNGLPRILFERHHFYAFTLPAADKKTGKKPLHPYAAFVDICFPKAGGFGNAGIHQYERFVKAATLDLDAAIKSEVLRVLFRVCKLQFVHVFLCQQ
jgi:N-acetylmuramidase